MPKVSKTLRDAIQELKEYRDSLAPQRGFFSTLDKLIEEAPFEDAPVDQWMNYLKPGRMYRREGLQFPLKQEELDYAIPEEIESQLRSDPSRKLNKQAFLSTLRLNRPSFGVQLGSDEFSVRARDEASSKGRLDEFERRLREIGDNPWTSKYPPSPESRVRTKSPQYGPDSAYDSENMRLSHTSPFSTYEESATTMRGYDYGRQHFDPDTISHSRTSSHEVADVGGGRARLVEEIQSDPHQDAAERTTPFDYFGSKEDAEDEGIPLVRRGYQDPRYSTYTEEPDPENWPSSEWLHAQRYKPQDAPFKTPAEYGRLELRKQLINAAREGEDYLAITRPEDQIERYSLKGDDAEAMRHIYGKVYRGELEKLAKQYGAEVTDVSLPVKQAEDVRPPVMRGNGYETVYDMLEELSSTHPEYDSARLPMLQELIDDLAPGSPSLAEQLREQAVDFDRVIKSGHPDTRADAVESFSADLQHLYDQFAARSRRTYMSNETKEFPAIRLTPEVRERIKRAGVPLWSVAGAAGLLELGRDLPDHEVEEPGMAKGGSVAKLLRKQFGSYYKTLTAEEKRALDEHVRLGYEGLRDNDLSPSELTRRITALNRIVQAGPELPDLTVYRGGSPLKENLGRYPLSTSLSRSTARLFAEDPDEVVSEILVPKGQRGLYLDDLYDWESQKELLLPGRGVLKRGVYGGPKFKWAEGGEVSSDDLVDRSHRLLDRLGESFMEQWSGLGESGDVRGFNPNDWASAGAGGSVWDADTSQVQPEIPLPGIYRDTVSMPAQFGYSGPGSDYMEDQLAELEALHAAGMDYAGLDEPSGLLEHSAGALGTMLAQPMLPGGSMLSATTARHQLGKLLKSPMEFLSPIVQPGAENYLFGTAFGAGQGELGDLMEHANRVDARNELASKIADMSYDDRRKLLRSMHPEDREVLGAVVADVERRELRSSIESLPADKRAKFDELVEQMEDHLREHTDAE